MTGIPLRLALPLVAMRISAADQREALGEAGIQVTKRPLPAQGVLISFDLFFFVVIEGEVGFFIVVIVDLHGFARLCNIQAFWA